MPPRKTTSRSAAVASKARKAPQGKKKAPVRKTAQKAAPKTARKRVAAKKDDGKPKRARSAYIFFSKEKQSEFAKSTPVPERGRIIGAAWKEMSESEKEPYKKMAEADKKRAERERAAHK